jgi:hypothetical protein
MVTVVVYFSKRIPILVGLSLLLGFLGLALWFTSNTMPRMEMSKA